MTDDAEARDEEAFGSPEDPYAVIAQWIEDAAGSEINDPTADRKGVG